MIKLFQGDPWRVRQYKIFQAIIDNFTSDFLEGKKVISGVCGYVRKKIRYISISTMTDEELRHNLIWFIGELERVCPRKKIQDTIQTIAVK